MSASLRVALAAAGYGLLAPVIAMAQEPAVKQVVKPPVAQAWIDLATYAGFNMGGGMGGSDMMNMTLGALMGGKGHAEFGYTVAGPAGRWMDVTLYTSRNPNLREATQEVPAASGLAPKLTLQEPEKPKPAPRSPDDEPAEWDYEPPKGRLVMYWGCSETVRPGQPKVVDLSTATLGELAKFFESRRATKRGAHAAAGRPIWPSRTDKRALPDGASVAGQHAFAGEGVPESFKFTVPAAQDLMPAMNITQRAQDGAVILEWQAIPHARAYFLGTMGAEEGAEESMVIWTSSELPDSGFGLFDYQTNPAVDQWLKEKVLLPPSTTRCAIPQAAAGTGMLRGIAYGTELNMAYPPRPTDPAVAWEPDWNVKIRVKSMTTTMLGMEGGPGMGMGMGMPGEDGEEMTDAPASAEEEAAPQAEPEEAHKKKKKGFNPLDIVKDVAKQL